VKRFARYEDPADARPVEAAFAKGMVAPGAVLLSADLVFAWAETALTRPAWLVDWVGAAFLAKAITVGALANGWRRHQLEAGGYRRVRCVEARTARAALGASLASGASRP
jgi:hypothetical protein